MSKSIQWVFVSRARNSGVPAGARAERYRHITLRPERHVIEVVRPPYSGSFVINGADFTRKSAACGGLGRWRSDNPVGRRLAWPLRRCHLLQCDATQFLPGVVRLSALERTHPGRRLRIKSGGAALSQPEPQPVRGAGGRLGDRELMADRPRARRADLRDPWASRESWSGPASGRASRLRPSSSGRSCGRLRRTRAPIRANNR